MRQWLSIMVLVLSTIQGSGAIAQQQPNGVLGRWLPLTTESADSVGLPAVPLSLLIQGDYEGVTIVQWRALSEPAGRVVPVQDPVGPYTYRQGFLRNGLHAAWRDGSLVTSGVSGTTTETAYSVTSKGVLEVGRYASPLGPPKDTAVYVREDQ